jgi:hypothetical protein
MQQLRLSDILPFLQELSMAGRLLLEAAVAGEVAVAVEVVEAAERLTRMPWCNLICRFVIFEAVCCVGMIEYRFTA